MKNIQLLLSQHVGAPCAPVVKAGDTVKRGTLVAEPTGLGANIFSSVDGVVKEVLDDRVVIEPAKEQSCDYEKIPEGSYLEMVKAAGIVGMGGAGFPAGIKFDVKWDNEGYVLVNASECEPGLKHNIAQIEADTEKVVRGAKYIKEISGAKKAIIAIKKINKKAVEAIDRAIANEPDVDRQLLPNFYPAGDERAIVRECLGDELKPEQLPTAAMAIVSNVETVARVAEAIEDRKPSFLKNVTVRGKMVGGGDAHILMDVPVGMAVSDVIALAGEMKEEYGEIIMGGSYTGLPCTLDDPIKKMTGALYITETFEDLKQAETGILVCASGGNINRMRDLATKYNANVVCECFCENAIEQKNGARKCARPGLCPGQEDNLKAITDAGAKYLLFGNCSDCADSVVDKAKGMTLIHQTDHAMKAAGEPLIREMTAAMNISQDLKVED